MTNRVYNFSAGPAMLPIPVMETVQKEFLAVSYTHLTLPTILLV